MGVGLAIGTDAMRACAVAPRWRGLRLRWCGLARLPRELIRASPREENIASVAGFRRYLGSVLRGLWVRRRLRVGLPDRAARVRIVFADELPRDPAACRRYLLWRLADALDCRPEDTRLAYMALPNPLPGHRLAVTCAVTGGGPRTAKAPRSPRLSHRLRWPEWPAPRLRPLPLGGFPRALMEGDRGSVCLAHPSESGAWPGPIPSSIAFWANRRPGLRPVHASAAFLPHARRYG